MTTKPEPEHPTTGEPTRRRPGHRGSLRRLQASESRRRRKLPTRALLLTLGEMAVVGLCGGLFSEGLKLGSLYIMIASGLAGLLTIVLFGIRSITQGGPLV